MPAAFVACGVRSRLCLINKPQMSCIAGRIAGRIVGRQFGTAAVRQSLDVTKFATLDFEQFGPLSAGHHFNFGKFRAHNRPGHGLLRLFDDGLIAPNARIPEHPHRNIDIVTVVLPENLHPFTGRLEGGSPVLHTDSHGFQDSIEPGSVQVMSVGSDGMQHAEMASSRDKSANAFQIWLRQTEKQPTSDYGTHKLPLAEPKKFAILASGFPNDNATPLKSPSRVLSVLLTPDQQVEYHLGDRKAYIAASSGRIEVSGVELAAHDGVKVANESSVTIKAVGEINSQVVVVDTI